MSRSSTSPEIKKLIRHAEFGTREKVVELRDPSTPEAEGLHLTLACILLAELVLKAAMDAYVERAKESPQPQLAKVAAAALQNEIKAEFDAMLKATHFSPTIGAAGWNSIRTTPTFEHLSRLSCEIIFELLAIPRDQYRNLIGQLQYGLSEYAMAVSKHQEFSDAVSSDKRATQGSLFGASQTEAQLPDNSAGTSPKKARTRTTRPKNSIRPKK